MPKKSDGAKAKPKVARAPAKRRVPRKKEAQSEGLAPSACVVQEPPPELSALTERIAAEGGAVIGSYLDPLGGRPLALAVLPIDKIEPTPFQRDLSDAHYKRLSEVINKTGRFLDPLIAITAKGAGFWTPNGRHRLEAMRRLGAKAVTALLVPDREERTT
jgi:ParB family chromosome partitioning protein